MQVKLYKGKEIINFEEERHIFSHKDGTKILGVTSITTLLDKSAPLMAWAINNMGIFLTDQLSAGQVITTEQIETAKREYRRIKTEAADIGKEIHDWIEQKIKGLKPAIPENELVRNGTMAYLKWMKTNNIEIKESERIIYSRKHDYAGICDWNGIDKDDKAPVVGDHKSSKGIYNEMRYQLAAYWNGLEEEIGKEFKRGYIVKFGKFDGEFEVLEIPRKEYKKDFKAFLGLLNTKRREEELKWKKQ